MIYDDLKQLKYSLEREIGDINKMTRSNMTCKQSEVIADLISAYKNIKKLCAEYKEDAEKQHYSEGFYTKYDTSAKTQHYMDTFIPMTVENAKKWVYSMKNADGTRGEHWTLEQTNQVKNKEGLADISDALFYAVMNMLYSDYSQVFKEAGVNTVDFYAKTAKAWIMDEDANPEKTSLYYQYIVSKT